MNISDFDLNLLVVFDAVLAEGGISRAADRLGLSQPAVSNALARLRKATGDRLFVRLANGMAPTPYAQRIAGPVRQALATISVSLSESQGFDAATSERSFGLYLTDLGEVFFLPRLLARLSRVAPAVRIRTLPMPTAAAQDALKSGEVDLAVGNLPDFRAGFYQQRLFREHYVCVVRRDHPAIRERITARQFTAASHAIVTPAGTGHGVIERSLIEHNLESRIVLRVQNFLVLPSIIAMTDLIALVPHSVGSQLSRNNDIKLLPVPIPLPAFDVKQCWHERFHDDEGNRWLRQQFAELFTS
ncbi:MAG: LysR family transcriptional regulator [Sulfuritalea sp.]|jgi:DNA-binding transcriptional LysR family regulator|nr:LysR family transcriptional regulator [Sulfuritalea sp.]